MGSNAHIRGVVMITVIYNRKSRDIDYTDEMTGYSLAEQISEKPDSILLLRDNVPVPIDEKLIDGSAYTIISVASGG